VQLDVVYAERLDLDHCVGGFRFRLWHLLDLQDIRPSELFPENCAHEKFLSVLIITKLLPIGAPYKGVDHSD
jgi:hypothetical protein